MRAHLLLCSVCLLATAGLISGRLPAARKQGRSATAGRPGRTHRPGPGTARRSLSADRAQALTEAAKDKQKGVAAIQDILDQRCLAGVVVRGPKDKPTFLDVLAGPAKLSWPSRAGVSSWSRSTTSTASITWSCRRQPQRRQADAPLQRQSRPQGRIGRGGPQALPGAANAHRPAAAAQPVRPGSGVPPLAGLLPGCGPEGAVPRF